MCLRFVILVTIYIYSVHYICHHRVFFIMYNELCLTKLFIAYILQLFPANVISYINFEQVISNNFFIHNTCIFIFALVNPHVVTSNILSSCRLLNLLLRMHSCMCRRQIFSSESIPAHADAKFLLRVALLHAQTLNISLG